MSAQAEQQELKVMSFGDHLDELRVRILRSLLIAVIGFAVAFVFKDRILEVVTAPHRQAMHAILVEAGVKKSIIQLGKVRQDLVDVTDAQAGALIAVAERQAANREELDRLRGLLPGTQPPYREMLGYLLSEADRFEMVSGEQSAVRRFERRLQEVQALDTQLREHQTLLTTAPFDELKLELDELNKRVTSWRATGETSAARPTEVQAAGTWAKVDLSTESVRDVRDRLTTLVDPDGSASKLHTFGYPESFFAHLKICFLVGILLGLPWITIELWKFVAAGLYPIERKAVTPFLPLSILGLIAGGTFAYTVLVPVGLTYLGGFGSGDVLEPTFRLKDYVSLVVTMILGMGLVFQLPLVMVFGVRAGFCTAEVYRRYRKFAIVGAVLIGSFLTPPDIVTQLLMAVPLAILYESGIWFSQILARKDSKAENPSTDAIDT